jgi:hypothetical protein
MDNSQIFDLRPLRLQSDPFRRRKRWVLIGAIALTAVWVAVFVTIDQYGLATGQISSVRLVTFIIVIGLAGLFLSVLVPGLFLTRPGGDSINIGDDSFEVRFSSGRIVTFRWADPDLSLELYDFSSAPSSSVGVSSRYFMRTRRTESVLTPEAYAQVLDRADKRNLVVRSARGSLWFYPSRVAPIIHYIRGRRAT